MTDRELMQQALEAVEFYACGDEIDEALIIALRERLAQSEPAQVSPLEFNHMTLDKEHMVGKPIFWSEWPNKAQA